MKKILIYVCILSVFPLFFPKTTHAEFEKTKVAVLDFELQGSNYETRDMGKIVAEWLVTALVKEGRFDVIERNLLSKIIEEQKLGISGLVEEGNAAQLGKLIGAKILITGSVMKFQNVIEVNARIIHVESASIIAAESVKSTTAIKLEDLVIQMAEKIIRDFPLEGYIINRNENTILIDLGKKAGGKKGMQFIVFKEGNMIKHPKTGEVLDVERIETGLIEITSLQPNMAEAKIITEKEPNAIQYAQMVKSKTSQNGPLGKYTESKIPAQTDKKTFSNNLFIPSQSYKKSESSNQFSKLDEEIAQLRKLKNQGAYDWKIKYKAILIQLKTILGTSPSSAKTYLYYAKIYYAVQNLKGADKFVQKALYYKPQYAEAFLFRGKIYFDYLTLYGQNFKKKQRFAQLSQEAYKNASSYSKDTKIKSEAFFQMGNIYAKTDNMSEAKRFWEKSIAIDPESESAKQAHKKLSK